MTLRGPAQGWVELGPRQGGLNVPTERSEGLARGEGRADQDDQAHEGRKRAPAFHPECGGAREGARLTGTEKC